MQIVTVCEKMGWTYEEYAEQPIWFLDLLFEKMKEDGKKAKREAKKSKNAR